MFDNKENIEEEINKSRERTNQRVRQSTRISFEREAEHKVTILKEKFENDKSDSSASSTSSNSSILSNQEHDEIYVSSCNALVDTIIKCEALRFLSCLDYLNKNQIIYI